MRTPIRLLAVTLPAAALCLAGPARAQSLEDRLRSQLVSVTSQLRAAQSSQAELSAQKAAAEKERDALKAKLATAQRPRRSEPAASPEYLPHCEAPRFPGPLLVRTRCPDTSSNSTL